MHLGNKKKIFSYNQKNFIIQNVKPNDVTKDYINALSSKFILNTNKSLFAQKLYVKNKNKSLDEYLFGLYLKKKLLYTSNVQINFLKKRISLGILRTNNKIRNMASIFIINLVEHLYGEFKFKEFTAGVSSQNTKSINCFKKAGFLKYSEDLNNQQFILIKK